MLIADEPKYIYEEETKEPERSIETPEDINAYLTTLIKKV